LLSSILSVDRAQKDKRRQLLADYQSVARPGTLPADMKTGLPR
jgi:hypothetical protein